MQTQTAATLPPECLGITSLQAMVTYNCGYTCRWCAVDASLNGDRRLVAKNQKPLLSFEEWLLIFAEAHRLGCRYVQLNGGDLMLFPDWERLIEETVKIGLQVEAYSTLQTAPDARFLQKCKEMGVTFGTSFYHYTPAIHDRITNTRGTWAAHVSAIQAVLRAGLELRVGLVIDENNQPDFCRTIAYLTALGVHPQRLRADRARFLGRNAVIKSDQAPNSESCGQCSLGQVAIGPTGDGSLCLLLSGASFFNIRETSLANLLEGALLAEKRRENFVATAEKRASRTEKDAAPEIVTLPLIKPASYLGTAPVYADSDLDRLAAAVHSFFPKLFANRLSPCPTGTDENCGPEKPKWIRFADIAWV